MFEVYITELESTGRLSYNSLSALLHFLTDVHFGLSEENRNWILQQVEPCSFPCVAFKRLIHSITMPPGFPPLTDFVCTANCQGYNQLANFLMTYDSL